VGEREDRHFERHNAHNNGHYIFNHVSITETPTLHERKITSRNVLFDYTTKSPNVFPSLSNVVSSGHHDLICLFVCLFYWVGRNGSFSWLVNSICVDTNLECVPQMHLSFTRNFGEQRKFEIHAFK
jgi:hypothetical protein